MSLPRYSICDILTIACIGLLWLKKVMQTPKFSWCHVKKRENVITSVVFNR